MVTARSCIPTDNPAVFLPLTIPPTYKINVLGFGGRKNRHLLHRKVAAEDAVSAALVFSI
jgi:hypothetical protein